MLTKSWGEAIREIVREELSEALSEAVARTSSLVREIIQEELKLALCRKIVIERGPRQDDDLFDWPCQQLLGGRPPYQGVNDLGRCQHPECHPRNKEQEVAHLTKCTCERCTGIAVESLYNEQPNPEDIRRTRGTIVPDGTEKEQPDERKTLWLNHGCPIGALYGDDGEMQCNNMTEHRPIDFLREPIEQIKQILKGTEPPKPTRKEWEEFFRMAFAEGESWGVTYHGWFTPDEEHQEKAAQKAMHRCFEAMPGVPKL